MAHADGSKIIVTSNIHMEHAFIRAAYSDLLVSNELVEDNAVLMLITIFMPLRGSKSRSCRHGWLFIPPGS